MNMPWKTTKSAPVSSSPRTVAELVTSFTGQFKEVANMNARIAETQSAIIRTATEKKVLAENEKQDAENFIANFESMRKAPVVK